MKRKIISILLSVLIAFGLWMYVVTVINPEWEETFYNIPVVFENEEVLLLERGLMLVSDEEPRVTLRLSGNRSDMIKLNSSNITLRVDLSRIYSAGEQRVSYTVVYPGDLPNNAFKIVSQMPQQIPLTVAEWKAKTVPVNVEFSGKVPDNYVDFRDQITMDYPEITITGPIAEVDKIVSAKVSVDLQGQQETISQKFDYVLLDASGNPVQSKWIKANAEQVQCNLKILPWKEVSLKLDVKYAGGLNPSNCIITQSVHSVRVVGNENTLADLNELFLETINLGEVNADEVRTVAIKLPQGVEVLNGAPSVDVTIDVQTTLKTSSFSVKSFQAINCPEGTKADIIDSELTVQVRGTSAALKKLTAADLEIHVDCTGAALGEAFFTAIVVVKNPALADSVGAIQHYKVLASVTAA